PDQQRQSEAARVQGALVLGPGAQARRESGEEQQPRRVPALRREQQQRGGARQVHGERQVRFLVHGEDAEERGGEQRDRAEESPSRSARPSKGQGGDRDGERGE